MVLGLLCIGSSNNESLEGIVTALMTREPSDLNSPYARYIALGLGLLFFGKQDAALASLEAVAVIEHPIKKYIETLTIGCAYACTGNVL
jgi:26S proteasome regulatory subunit N1